jgi:hypothetical protein
MEDIIKKQLMDGVKSKNILLEEAQIDRIIAKLTETVNYVPKIGIFGKTGVGKSSLVNALTGKDSCKIDDIEACTRNAQEVLMKITQDKQILLLDVPGVGETNLRDREYSDLYQELLPNLDLILWLIKADDRAFSSDELFYKNIVRPHLAQGKPLLFVINQADKIEPIREWDIKNNKPGYQQSINLENKRREVARYFDTPISNIIIVSAIEKYNLGTLVDEMVFALPEEKQYTFVKRINNDIVSSETIIKAKTNTVAKIVTSTFTGAIQGYKKGGIKGAIIGAITGLVIGIIDIIFSD